MGCIFNSNRGGLKTYVLDGICSKIIKNNNKITDDDIKVLLSLYGQTVLKAFDLIDKEFIELLTISNTERSFYSVQGSSGFYTLYPNINFCQCLQYKFSVIKKERDVMCKHLLACHIAAALGKVKKRNTQEFIYKFS